jgi:hypothetical protein
MPDGVTQGDLYARFWIKIRGKTATDNTVTPAWRMPWQFKTSTDYRVSFLLDTWNYNSTSLEDCVPEVHDNHPHWRLQGDSWAAVEESCPPFHLAVSVLTINRIIQNIACRSTSGSSSSFSSIAARPGTGTSGST